MKGDARVAHGQARVQDISGGGVGGLRLKERGEGGKGPMVGC